MVSYRNLFIRARNVLKKRYDIDLDENLSEIMISWLMRSIEIEKGKKISVDELKPHLEELRRRHPTKFYLLEQDLIKHIRLELQKPIIRDIKPVVDVINLNNNPKKDDDFEPSADTSGYIYY